MVKKAKKQVKDIIGVSFLAAGGSIAIGALGGSGAGMAGATRMLPAIGGVVGAGMVLRTAQQSFETKKKRRRKR